jgi:hypothetical protein
MNEQHEPFTVGQAVTWFRGEEMGETMTFGNIVEVIGVPYHGELACMFSGTKHTFRKSDGKSLQGDGYIRLIKN